MTDEELTNKKNSYQLTGSNTFLEEIIFELIRRSIKQNKTEGHTFPELCKAVLYTVQSKMPYCSDLNTVMAYLDVLATEEEIKAALDTLVGAGKLEKLVETRWGIKDS